MMDRMRLVKRVKITHSHLLPGVVRIDSKGTHGWQARIYRLAGKRTAYDSAFFSDGSPDAVGIASALVAAARWREREMQKRGLPVWRSAPLRPPTARNTTGVRGVFWNSAKQRNGSFVEFCVAAWVEHARLVSRKFSANRYGADEALRLACAARRAAEERIYGVTQPVLRARRFAAA